LPTSFDESVAIRLENVSKRYRLRRQQSLRSLAGSRRGRLLRRDGHHREQDYCWALKDVSFEVQQGEMLGIVGPNGAGKTTILKLLSKITRPTSGKFMTNGKLSALIELGAGFHPDLTGRENVYLNGVILGLTSREIKKRFDEIVAFAELEHYIDTPVKRYSSGMYVRLGFAVVAHIDPEILLVDEVLAVGDLAFQAKCRKRIRELVQRGVTIVFVSHNLHAVNYLCPRTIVLEKGQIVYAGDTGKAIDFYRASTVKHGDADSHGGTGEIEIACFEILDQQETVRQEFDVGDTVRLRIHYHAHEAIRNPVFNVAIFGMDGNQVTGIRTDADGVKLGTLAGKGHVDVVIGNLNLLPNVYVLNTTVFDADGFAFYDRIEGIAEFKVVGGQQVQGTTYLPHSWYCTQTGWHCNKSPFEECK